MVLLGRDDERSVVMDIEMEKSVVKHQLVLVDVGGVDERSIYILLIWMEMTFLEQHNGFVNLKICPLKI